jgi:hypothetical protein
MGERAGENAYLLRHDFWDGLDMDLGVRRPGRTAVVHRQERHAPAAECLPDRFRARDPLRLARTEQHRLGGLELAGRRHIATAQEREARPREEALHADALICSVLVDEDERAALACAALEHARDELGVDLIDDVGVPESVSREPA